MNISFNWLKQHLNLPSVITAEEVAEKLKMSTVEVEGLIKPGANLDNIVVGRVISADKHPEADKLKLCQVEVGNETVQIVCGGSNVTAGMLVALALVGAKVKWHGEGELVELKPVKIRNVESFGMICGASEIGLSEMFPPKNDHEIVDLTTVLDQKKVGLPLAEALNLTDVILEIDNKSLSNRPDLWGHFGLAREVAVLFGKELNEYKTAKITPAKEVALKVEVKNQALCPRYMAVAVSGVKVAESPVWLKERLTAVGLRPINNIVDITNYVMLDLGEPMHAFDASQLQSKVKSPKSKVIVVREAKEGETITLLDGRVIELTTEDLVIADGEKPIALAGVMGGEFSGITEATTTIVFEAANFQGASIRKSAGRHNLRTDASVRFEKCLDPNLCEQALARAVALTLEYCPEAKVSSAVIDEKKFVLPVGPIKIEKRIFSEVIGIEVPEKEIVKILTGLGFTVVSKAKEYAVKIPTWRATKDVGIAEDIVEEVARIYGYDNIVATMPELSITPPVINQMIKLKDLTRDYLTRDARFCEVENYAFISPDQKQKLGDSAEYLELDNPISKEKPLLRRSLLPNALENVVKNIEFTDEVRIYEIGKSFISELAGARAENNGSELLPRQDESCLAVFAQKKNNNPLNEINRALAGLMNEYGMTYAVVTPKNIAPWMHTARTASIVCGEIEIGQIYELHPSVAESFGLTQARAGVLEINLQTVLDLAKERTAKKYVSQSLFPEVSRDLAVVVDNQVAHADLALALTATDSLIKNIELFDIYSGDKLPAGKKSLAYRITLGSEERTLTTEEVEMVMKKIITTLADKFGAERR